jgi:hypothetical protein
MHKVFDWKRSKIWVLEVEAVPQSCIAYIQIGFEYCFIYEKLFFEESFDLEYVFALVFYKF